MPEEEKDSPEKVADAQAKPTAPTEVKAAEATDSAEQGSSPKAAPVTEGGRVDEATEPATTEPAATEPATAEPAATPKKGKKRKKSKALDGGASAPRSELDAEGRERPVFLLNFPRDPELEPLIAAFEAGNYAHVREFAPRLLERTEQPEVKAAAQELLERIEPDPLVKFLLAVAIALFVAVVAFVYHSHG